MKVIDRTKKPPVKTALTARKGGDPTVAVAFGGGGARGLAHIHVIEALNDLGITPVAISGSSIGAMMGIGMAAGMTGKEVREHTLATLGTPANAIAHVWKSRPQTVRAAMEGGWRLGQFNIERIVNAFLPAQVPTTFEELQIPAKIILTDYFDHCEYVCESGDLRNAIAASAAIPAVFKPVERNGRIYVDGGIYNPVPFDHLAGLADIIVAIDVVGLPAGAPGEKLTTSDLMFGANQLMMQSIIEMRRKAAPPDIFLRPDVHQFRVLDFLKAKEIIDASVGFGDQLKKELDAAFALHKKQKH